ncbi:MAG: PTS transporter subunit EIIC [Bacteroidales bacterium]|nr:PTS transporter subunit EIIC [Bacteroidales bacterium]
MSRKKEVKRLSLEIIEHLGGQANILNAENCMTRIRVNVIDRSKVNDENLENIDGVMGLVSNESNYIQVVVGPGRVRDVMTFFLDQGIREVDREDGSSMPDTSSDWQANKASIKEGQKPSKFRDSVRIISDIFTPMIPAFIASGVSNGLGRLLRILMENGTIPTNTFTELTLNMIVLIGSGFLAYLVIFTGVNAARQFRVNAMLGGMIGAAVLDSNINVISEILGWYNADVPSDSILSSGAGGVIGVIVGVWVLSKVEKWVHDWMPEVLDISFTPLISMFITMPILVLIIMPVTGYLSVLIANFIGLFVYSTSPIVRALTGYVLAATFLPLVLFGLHRGLAPIYTLQIEAQGFTTLFPAVAMAGAGQVGAAIALYIKAKRQNNEQMTGVIAGGLPAGILGIGEPLIYGVTLPLGKPFITAGLGAGFGGAYVMLMGVSSSAFSPSGILASTHILPQFVVHYLIGILISYIMGALITYIAIPDSMLER